MKNKKERTMTIRYRVEGSDWKGHGIIRGTWDDIERMGKMFDVMENGVNPMQKSSKSDANGANNE